MRILQSDFITVGVEETALPADNSFSIKWIGMLVLSIQYLVSNLIELTVSQTYLLVELITYSSYY